MGLYESTVMTFGLCNAPATFQTFMDIEFGPLIKGGHVVVYLDDCRELTTLWVARLDDGAELKVTDPKEQQRDVEEEEAEDKKRQERVSC